MLAKEKNTMDQVDHTSFSLVCFSSLTAYEWLNEWLLDTRFFFIFFIGKDASRAYVTGDFKNDLNDNFDGLTDSQIADIFNWKKFYDDSYTHLGVLQGRFYDSNGEKTQEMLKVEEKEAQSQEVSSQNCSFF